MYTSCIVLYLKYEAATMLSIDIEKFPSAKLKLEQFFLEWLILEGDLIIDDLFDELSSDKQESETPFLSQSVSNVAQSPISSPVSSAFSRSPKKRTQSEMLHKDDEDKSLSPSANGTTLESKGSSSDNHLALVAPAKGLSALSSLNSSLHEKQQDDDSKHNNTSSSEKLGSSRRRANLDSIPRFYFPGKVKFRNAVLEDQLIRILPEIEVYFKPYPDGIPAEKFVGITKKLCGIPSFFNMPFCKLIHETYGSGKNISKPAYSNVRGNSGIIIKLKDFKEYWKNEVEPYSRVERFFRVIKQRDSDYICKDDFVPFLKELLHFHPGLDFLASHDEFKRKYALTVITRIFYKVNISRTGKISLREVKSSNLFQEFVHVDEETDINKVTEYFSYEHFYVLYCRFFELDQDRDGRLKHEDLGRYGDQCLSDAIIDRVYQVGMRAFSDGVNAGFNRPVAGASSHLHFSSNNSSPRDGSASAAAAATQGGMTFPDFVYFMLAEEDKTTPSAIKFWFSCCDMDSDGRLTYDDMWHFYRAQLDRVAQVGQDGANFRDVLCQMLDYLHPVNPLSITIEDMIKPEKRVSSGLIFDVLFNMHKFMRFEMRDPFQEKLKREDGFGNDWNRFAYFEYIKLASEEEAAAEQNYMSDADLDQQGEGEGEDDDYMVGVPGGMDAESHGGNAINMDIDNEAAAKVYYHGQHVDSKSQQMFYDDDLDSDDGYESKASNNKEKFVRGSKDDGEGSMGDLTISAGAIDLSATQQLSHQLSSGSGNAAAAGGRDYGFKPESKNTAISNIGNK